MTTGKITDTTLSLNGMSQQELAKDAEVLKAAIEKYELDWSDEECPVTPAEHTAYISGWCDARDYYLSLVRQHQTEQPQDVVERVAKAHYEAYRALHNPIAAINKEKHPELFKKEPSLRPFEKLDRRAKENTRIVARAAIAAIGDASTRKDEDCRTSTDTVTTSPANPSGYPVEERTSESLLKQLRELRDAAPNPCFGPLNHAIAIAKDWLGGDNQSEISVDALTFNQQDVDNLIEVYNNAEFTTPLQESLFRAIKICKQRLRSPEPVSPYKDYTWEDIAMMAQENRLLKERATEPVSVDLEKCAKTAFNWGVMNGISPSSINAEGVAQYKALTKAVLDAAGVKYVD
jgi:hypothetical protein